MAMDADLLAELQGQRRAFAVFELDIGGTTRKYAPAWAGTYKGKVLEAGSITRGVSDSGFTLPRDSASVTIADEDRELEGYIFAAGTDNITGAAARIKIVSPVLSSSKWFTVFDGVIEDFATPSIYRWNFTLKRNDLALIGNVKIPYVQAYDWPNAPDASIGLPGQVVYGIHDSTGTSATGMVPTIYVDTSGFRYLLSVGTVSAVSAVYVAGVASAAGNWSATTETINGVTWSLIDFTSDQGSADVTVDCTGIASGTTNPATIIEHFLGNMVFNASSKWNGLDGSISSDPINETYVAEAEAFLDKKGIPGGRVIDSTATGLRVLEECCQEFQIPAFWTYDGDIAIRPDDHTSTDTYTTAAHFRQERSPEPETRSVAYHAKDIISEVRTQYLYDHAGGQFQRQLTVVDPDAVVSSPETLSLHWRESAI